jgi:hypothetical protein
MLLSSLFKLFFANLIWVLKNSNKKTTFLNFKLYQIYKIIKHKNLILNRLKSTLIQFLIKTKNATVGPDERENPFCHDFLWKQIH